MQACILDRVRYHVHMRQSFNGNRGRKTTGRFSGHVPLEPYKWTYADKHLGVLQNIETDLSPGSIYRGDTYGNMDSPIIDMVGFPASVVADPYGDYVYQLQNSTPNTVPIGWHPACTCFPPDTPINYPTTTPWILNSNLVSNEEWYTVCNLNAFYSDVGWGPDIGIYAVNWDSEYARNLWADKFAWFIEEYVEQFAPYRRITHLLMDNGNLGDPWLPWTNFYTIEGHLAGLKRLSDTLRRNLGITLIVNFGSLDFETAERMQLVADSLHAASWEKPFGITGRQNWKGNSYYDYGPPHGTIYFEYGLGRAIDNLRILLNGGMMAFDLSIDSYVMTGFGTGGITYPGPNYTRIGSTTKAVNVWDWDLKYREDAALFMMAKPRATDNAYVKAPVDRQIGTYLDPGTFLGDIYPPPSAPAGTWFSKDWIHWPAKLGAPTGDYSLALTEGGADIYNTATQVWKDCDVIILTRNFEHGSLSFNASASMSDDLEIRKNAVQVNFTRTLTGPTSATAGQPVTVYWTMELEHPANDWIGLYPAGAPNWPYAASTFVGTTARSGSVVITIPGGASGSWEFRYFYANELHYVMSSTPFTVT